MTKLLLTLLFVTTIHNGFAQVPNKYKFIFTKAKHEDLLFGRKCYQVDRETNGKKFIKEAPKSKCRPEKIKYIMRRDLLSNSCFEVDAQTGGEKFINMAPLANCKGDLKTKYIFDQRDSIAIITGSHYCYEVDVETNGEKYLKLEHSSKCTRSKDPVVDSSSRKSHKPLSAELATGVKEQKKTLTRSK